MVQINNKSITQELVESLGPEQAELFLTNDMFRLGRIVGHNDVIEDMLAITKKWQDDNDKNSDVLVGCGND